MVNLTAMAVKVIKTIEITPAELIKCFRKLESAAPDDLVHGLLKRCIYNSLGKLKLQFVNNIWEEP